MEQHTTDWKLGYAEAALKQIRRDLYESQFPTLTKTIIECLRTAEDALLKIEDHK